MSTSELVYSANIEGSAVEVAFELASSDEKRLAESTMILRRYVYEAEQNSPPMPWPPAEWLLSDQRIPPTILSSFIAQLISGKSPKSATDKVRRAAKSISEDICYAVTNGSWAMPKHLLLPMTVRHITGNAELIALLNRLGHGQSYTKTMELETAMCNAVTASQTALPLSISTTNNAVLHLCWDNFDLNEETASGTGTTHSTHGIVIQELADPDITTRTEMEMPRTGARSVKPREVTISPCFSKPKVEPNVVAHDSQAEHDIKESSYLIFTWLCCRKVGS